MMENKEGYWKCLTILKKRYEQIDGKKVRSIRINLLNKNMVLNFEKETSKDIDQDIEDILLPLVSNREKIYANQKLNSIRFGLIN